MKKLRSSVSYPRQPSLQNFDTTDDMELESPFFSQPDLSTESKTCSKFTHHWSHKIHPHFHEEPTAKAEVAPVGAAGVLIGDTKTSDCNTSRYGRYWTFFQRAKQARVEPGLVKTEVLHEEAINTATCFKILKSLGMKKHCQVKVLMSNLCNLAWNHQDMVLTVIQQYLQENDKQLATKHKFRILKVLETIITSGPFLSEHWIQTVISLALQHMIQVTVLEEVYQNAASDLLVAVWMHSSEPVMSKLFSMLCTGKFPHRSVLYTMGKIIFKAENNETMHIGYPPWNSSRENRNQRSILARVMKTRNNNQTPVTSAYDTWESHLFQVGAMSAHSLTEKTWREELNREIRKGDCSYPGQSSEKACLYMYYGVVLRASNNRLLVRENLRTLLGTSHQHAFQREYLEDIHWKWASSTVLLCYGHVAYHRRDSILTLADNIASRIVCYFQGSHWDGPLKKSFLTSTLMLIAAINNNKEVKSYKFSQKPWLVLCLMKLIEKEPQDTLCTSARQDAMQAIVGLSKLKPHLEVKEKSKLLYNCFQSIFTLPLVKNLEKHTCLMMDPPNIQVLYKQTVHALDQVLQGFLYENPDPEEVHYILEQMVIWMDSELSHVRQRAVRSSTNLLKFIVEKFSFKSKKKFTRLGCLVGILGMFCGDPDDATRQQAMEGMFYLYTILLWQKGLHHEAEAKLKENKRTLFICPSGRELASQTTNFCSSSSHIVKIFGDHFNVSQLKDLTMTVVDNLHCTCLFRAQTAAKMMYNIFEFYGNQLKEVREIGKRIYLQLGLIRHMAVKKAALLAISLLVQQHTQEVVFTFLEFSISMNRDIMELWKAVGSNHQICAKVLHLLLEKLGHRPSLEELINLRATFSESLAAMNILYELIFVPEYQNALKMIFPQFFFSMVTQIHYVSELKLQKENCSISVEAVKSLFSKNRFWKEFAYLELQDAWTQLATPISFFQGVSLLSRAMVDYNFPHIPGIMLHSISMLQMKEERQRMVAMIFFTEFLRSPLASKLLPRSSVLAHLYKGIEDSNLMVRVVSLHCFSNIVHSPEKGGLLRAQLPAILDALYDPREMVIMASLSALSSILYQLGKKSIGPFSLDIALSLRPFFDDDREIIRGTAIHVFGILVGSIETKESPLMKEQVCRSLIPLLFRLMDQEVDVVKKAKFAFFRCASFLKWKELEKLFRRIAWEEGLQALHNIWKCFMENMFSKMDLFLSQALNYVYSKQWSMRTAAALYIGHTINLLPYAVSRVLDGKGLILLYEAFAKLEEDEEKFIRHVATAHFTSLQRMAQLM
ncbi:maestro heat-like repeat family member 5 isoform X2 [Macrotis lagotis]|uniref:maestro heat-like repeat family member 5 isoform X2 n=1 Tax=Macrotis lagotis TaxID=92651 RepID=UPI003D68336A